VVLIPDDADVESEASLLFVVLATE